MPFRIDNYSETTSSLAERDFAKLNLLICGKLENRSTEAFEKPKTSLGQNAYLSF
jgi:c-di-AMP phosphodiesterase-like protein